MTAGFPRLLSPRRLRLATGVILVPTALICCQTYLTSHNTIVANGNWHSSKCSLATPPMGSFPFIESLQALAHGHLNLGAWHGFQEVFYRKEIDIERASFDFRVQDRGYFTFFFHREGGVRTGIRLSANDLFPSAWLRVTEEGRFLEKRPVREALLTPGRWSRLSLHAHDDRLDVDVDGISIPVTITVPSILNTVGFRGCIKEVLVDNVEIQQHDVQATIVEDFSNGERGPAVAIVCLAVLIVANVGLLLSLRMAGVSSIDIHLAAAAVNLAVLILGAGPLLFVSFYHAERYPTVTSSAPGEQRAYKRNLELVRNDIKEKYRAEPDSTVYRVLFLGTSQTYGEGARRNDERFPQVIEHRLNSRADDSVHFECINAGVRGSESGRLLDLYRTEWISLRPRIVVINLSNNDAFSEVYARAFPHNLRGLVRLSEENNAKVLFVLEANAFEACPDDLPLHATVREVGRQEGIAVVEMHNYLKAHYDDGFLWWDGVHATSFGQQLMADCIFDALLGMGVPVRPQ